MSQNKQENQLWKEYQNGIGKFFKAYRFDMIFMSNNGKDTCEDHYNLINGMEMWLDSQEGILLIVRSGHTIDGHFASQLSVTCKAEHSAYVFDILEKTIKAYTKRAKCPVVIQTSPCSSEYYKAG